jgi:hypothetical protein
VQQLPSARQAKDITRQLLSSRQQGEPTQSTTLSKRLITDSKRAATCPYRACTWSVASCNMFTSGVQWSTTGVHRGRAPGHMILQAPRRLRTLTTVPIRAATVARRRARVAKRRARIAKRRAKVAKHRARIEKGPATGPNGGARRGIGRQQEGTSSRTTCSDRLPGRTGCSAGRTPHVQKTVCACATRRFPSY